MTELITSGIFVASLFESVNWVQTFVSVFLGLLVGHAFREWSDDRKAKKSELEAKSFGYGGTWIDEIFDPEGKIKAKDRFEIAQYGNDLKGTIERIFCDEVTQVGKRWDFVGRVRDNAIIAIFWEIDATGSSYGCLHVQRTAAGLYDGNYISADSLRRFLNQDEATNFLPNRIRLIKGKG